MCLAKEEIGKILKNLRVQARMTQKEAAKAIGRKQQIIGHWETGYSQPDVNTLFALCYIYNADINEAFGFTKKKVELTRHEQAVIDAYRKYSDMQAAVDRLLGIDYSASEHAEDLAEHATPPAEPCHAAWNKGLTEEEAVTLVRKRYAAAGEDPAFSATSEKAEGA
jgi:transcriptional regulator with XRE-family HTH domain